MLTSRIKSLELVGSQQTYNIEMASDNHNYLLSNETGRPIHANSHSCAYIVVAYWCAWLKVHFPPEWWAAVMSDCDQERLKTYMNVARAEGVKFGLINIEHLTVNYTVDPETRMVTPGLTSIKGIGDTAANKLQGARTYSDIDDFVSKNGKDKKVISRLILLGAFTRYHQNIKATWMWYQYKYCNDEASKIIYKEINDKLLEVWTTKRIDEERSRQIEVYKKEFPNRNKIPAKILNWMPKVNPSRNEVMSLVVDDYALKERLAFEKEYLGYYWHNPMDMFSTDIDTSIAANIARGGGIMEAILDSIVIANTKKGNKMGRFTMTDGTSTCLLIMWESDLVNCLDYVDEGMGLRLKVNYDSVRGSFTLARNTVVMRLETK